MEKDTHGCEGLSLYVAHKSKGLNNGLRERRNEREREIASDRLHQDDEQTEREKKN